MIHECTNCARTTATGLVLRPSGKTFDKHTVSPTGDEICKGGKPQEVQPTQAISVTPKTGKVACLECGEEHKALKTPGKVMKHTNPYTIDVCAQRPDATVACPAGCQRTDIAMRLGKLAQHKNMALNTRCPGSNKTPNEAAKVKVEPIARPKKAVPKQRSADAESYRALSGRGKSELKAKRLADSVAQYGWTAAYKGKDGTVTLVLTRGTGPAEEQMQISWFDGACIGGDGKITHTYRGRTVAVRNASAVKQRAALSPEAIEQEHKRVATRKTAVRGPRQKKTPEQQRLLLPFDPKTADDETILRTVLGKTIVWENKTAGKTENDVVKKPVIKKTKAGSRNLSFTGKAGSRTVRIENLVSVG